MDDKRAALVERVADLVRFNHDSIAIAEEAVRLIRDEVLEEAARVAESMNSHGVFIAAAIRALKTTPRSSVP